MPPPGGKIDPPGDGAADLTRVAAGSHLELCYHVRIGEGRWTELCCCIDKRPKGLHTYIEEGTPNPRLEYNYHYTLNK